MRILHLTDRLSDRGGAYWHLLGVLKSQIAEGHAVHVAAGSGDPRHLPPACPWTIVHALDARTRQAAALDAVVETAAPDLIHVHTVVNPAVLEWAADRGAVITVQDHRYFCPGQKYR